MKSDIHPKYHHDTKVTCTCGNKFTTGSTLPQIEVEICSKCHPFFTGEMKFVDTQGRVEKFEALRQRASKLQNQLKKKKKAAPDQDQPDTDPKTLKEMMTELAKQDQSTETKKTSSNKKATSKK